MWAPCGEHFFSVSERDSGEIVHEIGDRCNFGLSQQSAKNLLKFQPQGRWELVWMQNRHRSNTGEGLQSFQNQNKTRGKEGTDPILESRIWTDANAGFSSFTNIDSQVMSLSAQHEHEKCVLPSSLQYFSKPLIPVQNRIILFNGAILFKTLVYHAE